MKDFTDKVAVITGGAGGLGRELARKAAAARMKIVIGDVQQDALDATVAELAATGAAVIGQLCDVRRGEQVEALAQTAMNQFGAVHVLFNNAGVGSAGLVWENSVADWEWVLGVNVWGVIHGIRVFTPIMLECAKREPGYEGHIVNTASMAGLLNAPAMGVYNVSKHAVVSLSESLYHDLQLVDAPIAASVLCPYFFPTDIHQSHRNRPDDVKMTAAPTKSQMAAQALVGHAVTSGKVTAEQVAALTFDAIANMQFYVFSHPEALAGVKVKRDEVLNSRNPSDPYQATPQVRQMLLATIKG